MDIHGLRSFIAVAAAGSITRASEQLCLSQPAVSAHIKALEEELRLVLFRRNPRGMGLTEDGARLLSQAEAILAAHRDFLAGAQLLRGRLSGPLRIAGGGNSDPEPPGLLVSALSARHPDIAVTLVQASSGEVIRGLREGRFDAGFFNASAPDGGAEDLSDLTQLVVGRFSIWLAAPKGMVADPSDPDWQVLAQQAWILPSERPSCCGQAAEALFLRHQFRPRQVIGIDREAATRSLIASGAGPGFLHDRAAFAARDKGELELICQAGQGGDVVFASLVSRAEEPLIAATGAIADDLWP
ncbi:LysR family transcriptional regulator [Paracoccus sp. IB05]|uniref:LysR substrate-binding domain-containing protein n=1 Tax=Paracoccus sp. IB05 TaxID=2779367 RepID=UPI001E41BAC3|nr:LysR family transcriptional regulator [Paracoccus sp. IB05]